MNRYCLIYALLLWATLVEGKIALLDPEMAPEEIRPQVMQGFYILFETKKYAPQYAGDKLSCTNCHFSCGNTLGGEGNGISLVGVPRLYPKKLPNQQEESLAQRINACFEKSMHGNPMPVDSQEMKAMIAYLEWISSGVPPGTKLSWLGVKKLRTSYQPDPKKGEQTFAVNCAMCHGKDGQGEPRADDLSYPPLWGKGAFTHNAGMNKLETFAGFIYENMPYQNVGLTVEQALDIASYVTSQQHPSPRSLKESP